MLSGHNSDLIEFEFEYNKYIVVYKDAPSRDRMDGIQGKGDTLGQAIENLLENIMQEDTDDDSPSDM